MQGQCFYPAGHLYHYIPAYYLYLLTDKAEYIWKALHFFLHSAIQYNIGQIAYLYFKDRVWKAQLVCFLLLGNEEIREFNAYLFNDTFLALYIIISLRMVAMNKPMLAAFFLTMSLSIKAGGMLMIPSFLGWIQYQYGT